MMSPDSPSLIKNWIAWDTSSTQGCVVSFDSSGKLISEWSLSLDAGKHSERLLWAIDQVLDASGWALSDVSGIGVGVGPGSFTGLRIGVTTARMLSFESGIPVVPVSSLQIWANETAQSLVNCGMDSARVLVATDAAKGEWFTLSASARDLIQRKSNQIQEQERVQDPEQWLKMEEKEIKKKSCPGWVALGTSVQRYSQMFEDLPKRKRIQASQYTVQSLSPRGLANQVLRNIQESQHDILPRYLRASDAEVKAAAQAIGNRRR